MALTPGTIPDAGRPPGTPEAGGTRGALAALGRRLASRVERIASALLVVAVGIVLGQQYMQPDKRVLSVIGVVVLAGLAWRLDLVTSIGAMIFLLPYPKVTTFGTTTTAIALLIAILWLVNASRGTSPGLRRTPIDMALLGLIITYACSFYNITDAKILESAIQNFEIFLASVLCYYVIVANVNSSRALEKVHAFQLICALSVFLLGVYEVGHAGASLAGGWINLSGSTGQGAGEEFSRHNVRIGSAFGDYELLSEFCVLTFLQGVFLLARATSRARRALLAAFLLLNLFVLFATVTRGAVVSLIIGLLLMLWTTRRRLQFVPIVLGFSLFVVLFVGMNYYVAHFTSSGDMFGRMSQTHFEGGVPDNRVGTWAPALARAMKHPWVGAGPFYVASLEAGFLLPHNLYLFYASIVGFVGLGFFLLILAGFARMTRPTVDSLRHPDYARAFQIVTQAQLVAFIVNESKIEYLRNPIYQTVVWVMFSMWVATYFVARDSQAAEASARAALAR